MGAKHSISSDAKLVRGAKPARKKPASQKIEPEVAVGATFMLPFEATDGPPWLVDEKPSIAKKAKVSKAKKAPAKVKPKLAKRKATKKAKTPATLRVRKSKPDKTVAVQPNNDNVPAAAQHAVIAPAIAAPLPRAQAPVVWQKNRPLDAISYWLRTTTKTLVGRLRSSGERKRLRIAKPRTRQQLLLELAVLREENAKLRAKLELPPLPFGRQIVDTI
jgi:hypothetical protein